jgi:hypothetical protein
VALPPLPIEVPIVRPADEPAERRPPLIGPRPGDVPVSLRDPATSLMARLAPTIDAARQLAVDLGMRYYDVLSIVVRWSGGERGRGDPTVVSERRFTPTPKVTGVKDGDRQSMPGGTVRRGDVELTKISPQYSYDDVLGLLPRDLRSNEEHFIELVGDGRDGRPPRSRYTVIGDPERTPTGWKVRLTKADEDRRRDGTPR